LQQWRRCWLTAGEFIRRTVGDGAALRDEQRQLAIVETRDVDIGIAGQAELACAEIDFGAAVARHPQVVAARDRIL